jgi:putative hydrolase of the HAD superfamily
VADNVSKDFIAPNIMGWQTICLIDNGKNIHKQQFEISAYFTLFKIQNLVEIVNLI